MNLHPASIHRALTKAINELYGDFGEAATRTGLVAKYCNPATKIGIIRCRRGPHELLASAIPYVRFVGQHRAFISTLYMGATMRHCFKFILDYQQTKLEEYCMTVKSEEEKKELKKIFLNMKCVSSII